MIKMLIIVLTLSTISIASLMLPREIERQKGKNTLEYSVFVNRTQLRAPSGPVRNIAEFEPHEGVIVSYSDEFGISLDVIKEISEVAKIYCLSGDASIVQSKFSSAGITNYEIVNHSPDAYWTRDSAPWWIFDGNGDACIIDFNYNRPRPQDNAIPAKMASIFSVTRYDMGINDAGGNYMCDGLGTAAATNLVFDENPGVNIDSIKKVFLGIENYITMADPNLDQSYQIDHIDCWGKFLSPDKIMIRKVPKSNKSYDLLENVADMFANKTSSYGTKYKVFRTYASNGEPYTNCLIINNKVLVPIKGTANDAAALQSYKDAMPGYTVVGMSDNGYPSWLATDALHCRTKGIPDREMLYIGHIPVIDTVKLAQDGGTVSIMSKIVAHSGSDLYTDSLLVYYRYDGAKSFNSTLFNVSGDSLEALIPAPQSSGGIEYYIHAADKSGRSENLPYIGEPDPFKFYADITGTDVVKKLEFVTKDNFMITSNSQAISIKYSLKNSVNTGTLKVYNIKGKLIKTWDLDNLNGKINWNWSNNSGRKVGVGTYIFRFESGNNYINKMVNYTK